MTPEIFALLSVGIPTGYVCVYILCVCLFACLFVCLLVRSCACIHKCKYVRVYEFENGSTRFEKNYLLCYPLTCPSHALFSTVSLATFDFGLASGPGNSRHNILKT